MRAIRRFIAAAASSLLVLACGVPAVRAAGTASNCTFARVSVQVPLTAPIVHLNDVKMISSTDGWAVGSYAHSWVRAYPGARTYPLIEQWDGSSWRVVPVPLSGPRPYNTALTKVAVMSPTSVWAIGSETPVPYLPTNGTRGVLYRWNGRGWWRARLPHLGGVAQFTGIDVVHRGDVWIVGSWRGIAANSPTRPLFLHWDGQAWSIQRKALFPGNPDTWMTDVTSNSAGVVAVGFSYPVGMPSMNFVATLTEGAWVPSQLPSTPTRFDHDVVSALSGDWGVGGYTDVSDPDGPSPLGLGETATALQLGPTGWASVPTPILKAQPDDWDYVSSVGARDVLDLGTSDAWMVGSISGSPGPPAPSPFIERWDGAAWSVIDLPAMAWPTSLNALGGDPSSGTIMAVGEFSKTKTEHLWHPVAYEGTCSPDG